MTMVRVPFWVTVSVKRLTGARTHSSRLAKVGARRGLLPASDNILLHHLVRLIPPLLQKLVPLLELQVGEIEHPLLHHPDRPRPSLAVPPQMGCSNLHRRAALFLGSTLLGVRAQGSRMEKPAEPAVSSWLTGRHMPGRL